MRGLTHVLVETSAKRAKRECEVSDGREKAEQAEYRQEAAAEQQDYTRKMGGNQV